MRVRDWRIVFAILILCALAEWSWASCPLLIHADASDQREFQNVCQQLLNVPIVTVGAGVPNFTPRKIGDEYIDTTNSKVYFSTAAVTSKSWAIVN